MNISSIKTCRKKTMTTLRMALTSMTSMTTTMTTAMTAVTTKNDFLGDSKDIDVNSVTKVMTLPMTTTTTTRMECRKANKE